MVGDFGLAAKKVDFLGGGISEEEVPFEVPKDSPIQMPTTGTLRLLPPEAWRGAEPDFNGDIYSFAITAWEVWSLSVLSIILPFSL